MLVIIYRNSLKTAANGNIPPNGTKNFILIYHGYDGISLESLLICPGFLIVVFLKPINDPSMILGTERMQYKNR